RDRAARREGSGHGEQHHLLALEKLIRTDRLRALLAHHLEGTALGNPVAFFDTHACLHWSGSRSFAIQQLEYTLFLQHTHAEPLARDTFAQDILELQRSLVLARLEIAAV